MEEIKNEFTLETITKDILDRVLEIYDTNQEYFMLSMNEKPSMESVIEDMNSIPPESGFEKKNYSLIKLNGKDIGVIDYIVDYPDEDAIYIGLFMIDGRFHRNGWGKEFLKEFIPIIKSQGYKRIRLGVLDRNKIALEFWTNRGFMIVKEVISTIHPKRNWKVKVMEKTI
ncbi:MAG: GNAT family N-acetyltransferase [Tissierellaceae bacterium]|nr:GNAT family N-acetyltransferase [Tissierellaceae bacterium]